MDQYIVNVHDTLDVITYLNGKIHSIEGAPAVITNSGYQFWFFEGQLHRHNGPAVINPNGIFEYWFEGSQYSKNEFDKGLEFY